MDWQLAKIGAMSLLTTLKLFNLFYGEKILYSMSEKHELMSQNIIYIMPIKKDRLWTGNWQKLAQCHNMKH